MVIRFIYLFKYCSTPTHYITLSWDWSNQTRRTPPRCFTASLMLRESICRERQWKHSIRSIPDDTTISGIHINFRLFMKVSSALFALQVLLVMKDWEWFSHGSIYIYLKYQNVLLVHIQKQTQKRSKQWANSERSGFYLPKSSLASATSAWQRTMSIKQREQLESHLVGNWTKQFIWFETLSIGMKPFQSPRKAAHSLKIFTLQHLAI